MRMGPFPNLCGAALLLSMFAQALSGGVAFGEAPIVKEGVPRAEIVVSEQPARMAKLAASELQTYIEKISGARLPLVTTPRGDNSVRIYVGRSEFTDRLKIAVEDLEHDAYRMASGANWLALVGRDRDYTPVEPYARIHGDRKRAAREWDKLTGARWAHPGASTFKGYNKELNVWAADERGSLNAVYDYLRSLGVRWYFPGDLGEVLPVARTITLPQVNRTVRPDFAYRNLGFYGYRFFMASPAEVLWQLRLGLNWRGGTGGHGIDYAIHHENTRRAHPEYYMLVNGKRDIVSRGGKPCLSSEGLLRSNVAFARAYFDIYGAEIVSVMPTDGYVNLCQCDLCRGKGSPERGYKGQISDYVWGYVDRVARDLYKTHPKKKVGCYAYGAYMLPPEKIDMLSPNVVVGICQSRAGFHNREVRKEFLELRKAWLRKLPSKELYTWEYYLYARPGRSYEGLPVYYPHLIAEDLRSLRGICRGEGIEVYTSPARRRGAYDALAVNHLNCYVTARLWWDARRDVGEMLDEYYVGFYGPAAREMKAFVEYCEANWPQMMKEVPPIDEALKLLAAARKAAGDTVYGRRIALIDKYVTPVKQLREKLSLGRKNVPAARAYLRRSKDIKLDGKLNEKAWQGMATYHLRELQTGRETTFGTSFRAAWAEDGLYFGIVCLENTSGRPNIAARKDGDTNIWNGDCIELLLETQAHAYYQIAVSPGGAVVDADRKRGINTLWSSGAESATHIGDGFWSLEIRIPVANELQAEVDPNHGVAGRKPSRTHPWYFNVCRQRVRDTGVEVSAFSPTGKRTFHDTMKFGKLYMR